MAYRFLHESPWERLDLIREKAPNLLLQMLLRGANAVGYTNYPDNVIREFIKEAARSGIDVFRIFDSLNWIPGMEVAMDEVLNQDKICQATICYTGDILDPKRDKYTLDYYVKMAKELEHRGAHMLAIKDMSGLLKPYAAKKLVSTLKQEIGIPHPAPHPRHHRKPGGGAAAGRRGRRGRGGLRHQFHGGYDQPALSQRRGGGHAGHRPGHRPGSGAAPDPHRLLGGRAQAL